MGVLLGGAPDVAPAKLLHAPTMRIGHVHLKVADLDRSLAFYRDALGLNLTADGRERGLAAAFLAAGDYHHHIGINTWESEGATPPPPGHTGLYHVAFVYPDRRELGRAVQRLLDHGVAIDHGSDNGVELYYDRPRHDWFDADGRPILKADRFDPQDLLP